MNAIERKVAQTLLQIKAIKLSPANYFTWASGWHSPIYCDNRKILSFPEARKLVYESFAEVIAEEYPEVEYSDILVDNTAMQLIKNPAQFDVLVTENMFGDILSDEASMLTGSIGMMPSASLSDTTLGMYEPIHGSAPRMIEAGIGEYANPTSIFKAVEMLLRHICLFDRADQLAAALKKCCDEEKSVVVTGFKDGNTCKEFADYVMSNI